MIREREGKLLVKWIFEETAIQEALNQSQMVF